MRIYELHRRGAWCDNNHDIAGLTVPSCAITLRVRQIQALDFTLLPNAIFNYHIPIYDHSGST